MEEKTEYVVVEQDETQVVDEATITVATNSVDDTETKDLHIVDDGYGHHSFVPFGVISFEELEAAQDAEEVAKTLKNMSEQFKSIVSNIMNSPDVEDKSAAVTSLAAEFSTRIDTAMEQKERWQPLTDKVATKVDEIKQRPMKTEGGIKFPASDFAFVPDAEKPSTWKLRLAEDRPGNITIKQLGRAAAAFSPGGFRGRKVQIPSGKIASVKSKIRSAYRKLGVKAGDIPASLKEQSFTLWKEADGSYRWLAVYSNNYRDDDSPAEIISGEAHKDFVKAVDTGEWDYPELWAWHVPGTRWGVSDFVAYDEDTGFSLAAGTVDKGCDSIAEIVASREDYLVSHGMPTAEIHRNDESDLTVITRYRTKEISPLPSKAAANKFTQFVHLTKEGEVMTIPKNKRTELEALGFDVDELEAQLVSAGEKASEEGRESKELEVETKDEGDVTETASTEEPEVSAVPDIAQIIANTINDALAPLTARLNVLEAAGKEKKVQEDQAPATPLDTFTHILRSRVIGAPAASIDGRTKEARDGPEEVDIEEPRIINSGNPLADSMVSRIVTGATYKELAELRRQQEERLQVN